MHPIADIPSNKDIHATALKSTEEILIDLERLRKRLELTPDMLPTLTTVYLNERTERTNATTRMGTHDGEQAASQKLPMPIISMGKDGREVKIKRDEKAYPVITRPQVRAFCIESLVIDENPTHWIVDDIKVGNRAQFVVWGSVPGSHFAPDGSCHAFQCDTAHASMDVVVFVRYVGPEEDGAVFKATAFGTAVVSK